VNERRTTPRTCLAVPVTCRVAADPPLSAAVRDVCANGLSFLSSRALPCHAPVWVEMVGKPPLALRLAHVTPRSDGAWLIGGELLDPGDCEALAGLQSASSIQPPPSTRSPS
jgi:hypothetical protein